MQTRRPSRLLKLAFICTFASPLASASGTAQGVIPPQFRDAREFASAIDTAARSPSPKKPLSGITVPHHLLAANLIASAFQAVDASRIEKVILLFPDHFKRSQAPFATTRKSFETVFGRIDPSDADIRFLLTLNGLVEDSELFESDHGIGAVVPFVKHYMPTAKIVPIAVAIGSQQQHWDRLLPHLRRVAGSTTLVVQSTDFSHYLPTPVAVQRDQEVLNILAAGRWDLIPRLRQPSHTDSRGALYLQVRLQDEVFHARPAVLFNSNSHAFGQGAPPTQTTSYIVQLFEPNGAATVGSDVPGSSVYCFAGNTFFGRGMLRILASESTSDMVQRQIKGLLNGCRLIVNLTGVIVPELPANLPAMVLAMPQELSLRWLRSLNVKAVSLANNHTHDLGEEPFDQMAEALAASGTIVLKHGSVADLGPFRLAALTDLDNRSRRASGVVSQSDLAQIAQSPAKPPLFAMMNWGTDYDSKPRGRELALTEQLRDAAVGLIVGVHPHVAAQGFDVLGGGQGLRVFSLGNFLFDQGSRVSSGSILEVRIFDQGTYFARLIPIPNFYDKAVQIKSLN
jgi:poly-gamma-glutamate synthesis protein (capsule biosynthesis protein)